MAWAPNKKPVDMPLFQGALVAEIMLISSSRETQIRLDSPSIFFFGEAKKWMDEAEAG